MNASLIARSERIEFWNIGTEVYRVPAGSPLDHKGIPLGYRWECSLWHWNHYRACYDWAQDVEVAA